MTRILNAESDGYSPKARSILASIGALDEPHLSRSQLLECIANYDALIVRFGFQIDREIIDAGFRLKFIVTPATGLDHIDVEHARSKGVQIVSLKGETAFLETISATAEHTWALLLALARNIPRAFESVCSGVHDRNRFRGTDLQHKTLGIIGLGRVGGKVIRYGQAFEMNVLAFDPYRDSFPQDVERCGTLENLLDRSDVVSIHVPLTEETASLIGWTELAAMRRNAILINTSRARIVDEIALGQSLLEGTIAGAALDFISDDCLVQIARERGNLLITPHLGGATKEAMENTEVFVARRLKTLL